MLATPGTLIWRVPTTKVRSVAQAYFSGMKRNTVSTGERRWLTVVASCST